MTRNYTITEEPNRSTSQGDSPVKLQAIANILHGAGTDDEKIELIRTVVN